MKKQIIVSGIIAATILSGTCFAVLNNAKAEDSNSSNLVAVSSELATPTKLLTSKDETVYIITDESGAPKSKFIGSTIYDGTESLPFDFKITYYLDGQEISAKDLSGKSGHVKIVYSYSSTKEYLGRNIPFVALTGLTLDHNNFSNLKLENGKIVTETADSYIITGYAIAGLNSNLSTNLLPESFTIEADTKDFQLKDSYTIFTNEILADIDTSKLNSLDSLVNSIYQLSDALDQIIAGSTELSNGLATALDGTKTIYTGSKVLASGLKELESHNEELVAGANQIKNLAPTIAELIQEKIASLENQRTDLEDQLATIPEAARTIEPYATYYTQITDGIARIDAGIAQLQSGLSNLSSLNDFYQGLINYTDGVANASTGASNLSNGIASLVDGTTKLYNGSITLKDGLTTFKSSGIDKLIDFASKDLTNFTNNLRATVTAASSYHSFGNVDANSVKFIIKTPSI